MKHIITSLAVLVFVGCRGVSYQWFDGNLEEAQLAAGSKLIFIKFYTNT